MRSILEKAIVHLLNEEQDKAEALFHRFMVEKARKIHESLRSGEAVLAEGWDDEITSEEYMTEDDLESVEDHDSEGDDLGADEAADDLGADMDAEDADADAEEADVDAEDADVDAEDADADAEEGEFGDEGEGEGDTDERLADMESQIEKLTAEFDKMMAEIDGDDHEGDEDHSDDMGDDMGDMDAEDHEDMEHGDHEDFGHFDGEADDMGDDADLSGETDGDMADRLEDDVTDEDADAHDEMSEGMFEGKKGKVPPQFLKNMKKKGVKEESKKDGKKPAKKDCKPDEMCEDDDMGDEDLDDITESVMAELEKISVSMEDGKEIAAGKKISTNDKSPMIQATVDKRGGAKPVVTKSVNHQGFERETAPGVKDMPKRKNTVRGKADSVLSRVPEKGDKSAKLNSDFAGSSNKKSAID